MDKSFSNEGDGVPDDSNNRPNDGAAPDGAASVANDGATSGVAGGDGLMPWPLTPEEGFQGQVRLVKWAPGALPELIGDGAYTDGAIADAIARMGRIHGSAVGGDALNAAQLRGKAHNN